MYAVIDAGGKQERVEVGSTVAIERLGAGIGDEVQLTPLLVVDGDDVLATPDALGAARVAGKIVGSSKGPKIVGFTYRPKARGRRRFGHRQGYTDVEITAITTSTSAAAPRATRRPRAPKTEE